MKKTKAFIDKKAREDASGILPKVGDMIRELNEHIEGEVSLSENKIREYLAYLIGHVTLTEYISMGKQTILRARLIIEENIFCTSQLSYVPKEKAKSGRLNQEKESIFYGCLCWSQRDGINVAFSETKANSGDTVYLLRSQIKSYERLDVVYVGIYNYILKNSKPAFLSDDMYQHFCAVYEYQRKKFSRDLFMAFQLCDSFLSDIMSKKYNDNALYEITSTLGSLFLEDHDGILYTSVEERGYPLIALKPEIVDKKLQHLEVQEFKVTENYGYCIYRANNVRTSHNLLDKKINW